MPFLSCTQTSHFTQTSLYSTLCRSGPFGSHVLEKVLVELGKRAPHAGDSDFEEIEGVRG